MTHMRHLWRTKVGCRFDRMWRNGRALITYEGRSTDWTRGPERPPASKQEERERERLCPICRRKKHSRTRVPYTGHADTPKAMQHYALLSYCVQDCYPCLHTTGEAWAKFECQTRGMTGRLKIHSPIYVFCHFSRQSHLTSLPSKSP